MNKVEWNDQELADAFIEKGQSHGITVSPETAFELAQEVRGKAKKGDELELKAILHEMVANLFKNDQEEVSFASNLNQLMNVISNRIKNFEKTAQDIPTNERPISPEEEVELRAGILKNDIVIPTQEGVSRNVAKLTRRIMKVLGPLVQSQNDIEEFLTNSDAKIDALYDDWAESPTSDDHQDKKKKQSKLNKYRRFKSQRKKKKEERQGIQSQINILKSKLLFLDRLNTYVKKNLYVPDDMRDMDGFQRYFRDVLKPVIEDVKGTIVKIQQNIVLPEVTEKERHRLDWLSRSHNTLKYQDSNIAPNVSEIDMQEFSKSPVYEELKEQGVSDEKMSESLDALNAKPMTWRKGHAIYMLLDPPAQKTKEDATTIIQDDTSGWQKLPSANTPYSLDKKELEKGIDNRITGTHPRGMTKNRKLSEASNPYAHWTMLLNLTRNQKLKSDQMTSADQFQESLLQNKIDEAVSNYLSTIPEEEEDSIETREKVQEIKKQALEDAKSLKDEQWVLDKEDNLDEKDMLNDRDIILAAMNNPSVPDWVLMRASVTGSHSQLASNLRRVAKAILERKRGWELRLDGDGNKILDPETNDFVWDKVGGFSPDASFDVSKLTFSQVDQNAVQKQQTQQQIDGLDSQIQNNQIQIENIKQRSQQVQDDPNMSAQQKSQQRATLDAQIESLNSQAQQVNNQKSKLQEQFKAIPTPGDNQAEMQNNMAQPTMPVTPPAVPAMASISSRDIVWGK